MLDTLKVLDDCTQLGLVWEDGSQTKVSAHALRANAKDAASIRQVYDYKQIKVQADIRITAMEMVGLTGVNIHFSDGHDRAIYPIPYLKELSDRFDN